MRIKEAASACNLTEKAIRLYEERGLITPTVVEKNGRKFRDYDEATVARLQTVAILRRALFSLEQIAEMLDSPENIPAVFDSYRADIESNYASLKPLLDRAQSLDTETLTSAEAVSEAMTRPDARDHAEELPSYHFRVWNEEMARDEREEAYRRCQKYMQNWGRFYSVTLFFDRIFSFLRRNRRRTVMATLLLLAVVGVLYHVPVPIYVQESVVGYELRFDEAQEEDMRQLWLSMTSAELTAYDTSSMSAPAEIIPREITLSGYALYYLFRDDVFDGYLDIAGYKMHLPQYAMSGWYGYYRELVPEYAKGDDRRRVRFTIERSVEYLHWGSNLLYHPKERPAPYLDDTFTSAIRYITLTKHRLSCAIGLPFSSDTYTPSRDLLEFGAPWGDDMIVFSLDNSIRSEDDAVRVYLEQFWKPQYASIQRNKERTRKIYSEKYAGTE